MRGTLVLLSGDNSTHSHHPSQVRTRSNSLCLLSRPSRLLYLHKRTSQETAPLRSVNCYCLLPSRGQVVRKSQNLTKPNSQNPKSASERETTFDSRGRHLHHSQLQGRRSHLHILILLHQHMIWPACEEIFSVQLFLS